MGRINADRSLGFAVVFRFVSVNQYLKAAKEILYPPRNATERFLVASH